MALPAQSNDKGKHAGKEVGNVLILERTDQKYRTQYIYKCQCLLCGKEFLAEASSVLRGHTNSCGCIPKKPLENMQADRVDGTRISMLSAKTRSDNTSGRKGVSKADNAWMAYINFKQKYYYLGRYKNIEDAINAREQAEKEIFYPAIIQAKENYVDEYVDEDVREEHEHQKGVYLSGGTWKVVVCKKGEQIYVGRFSSFLQATAVYKEASSIKTIEGIKAYKGRLDRKKRRANEKYKKMDENAQKILRPSPRYIYELTKNGETIYRVHRKIKGTRVYFGQYKEIEEAIKVSAKVAAVETLEDLLSLKKSMSI